MSDDRFRYDDAAYVLGALDPADRAAFEVHLAGCADCRDRVAAAQDARGLLSLVSGADLEGSAPVADPMPDILLPGLLRRAARQQRRRRLVLGTIGAAAAAAVIALVVAVWPTSDPKPAVQQFTAVRSAPVAASGILVAKQWGTQINLECRYTRDLAHGMAYRLVVIDNGQRRYDAGGWTLGDREVEFTGGTRVRREDIAAVQITLADGEPVLQLTP